MHEILSRFDSGELIGLVAIVGGFILGGFVIAVHYWHKVHETDLKREMLARGLSAEEIKTVLEATDKR
jgi:hypothetical protein